MCSTTYSPAAFASRRSESAHERTSAGATGRCSRPTSSSSMTTSSPSIGPAPRTAALAVGQPASRPSLTGGLSGLRPSCTRAASCRATRVSLRTAATTGWPAVPPQRTVERVSALNPRPVEAEAGSRCVLLAPRPRTPVSLSTTADLVSRRTPAKWGGSLSVHV
jgi:hypothetical protein